MTSTKQANKHIKGAKENPQETHMGIVIQTEIQ